MDPTPPNSLDVVSTYERLFSGDGKDGTFKLASYGYRLATSLLEALIALHLCVAAVTSRGILGTIGYNFCRLSSVEAL